MSRAGAAVPGPGGRRGSRESGGGEPWGLRMRGKDFRVRETPLSSVLPPE